MSKTIKRNALIARIHIAKSRAVICPACNLLQFSPSCSVCHREDLLPLDDQRYRTILTMAGGSSSCKTLSNAGLLKAMEVFDRAGFAEEHPYVSPKSEQNQQRKNVARQIRHRAPQVLGASWEARVKGFMRKNFDKESLEFLTAEELRTVIGWINRTDKYQKRSNYS